MADEWSLLSSSISMLEESDLLAINEDLGFDEVDADLQNVTWGTLAETSERACLSPLNGSPPGARLRRHRRIRRTPYQPASLLGAPRALAALPLASASGRLTTRTSQWMCTCHVHLGARSAAGDHPEGSHTLRHRRGHRAAGQRSRRGHRAVPWLPETSPPLLWSPPTWPLTL